MTVNPVLALLEERLSVLEPTTLRFLDDSAAHRGHQGNQHGGMHLELQIGSQHFDGLTTLAAHRLVYQQVSDLIPHPVHALSIKLIRLSE